MLIYVQFTLQDVQVLFFIHSIDGMVVRLKSKSLKIVIVIVKSKVLAVVHNDDDRSSDSSST